MQVMVLVKESPEAEAGELPPAELFLEMSRYNEALLEAGVMLAADGLAPSSVGKRVAFDSDGANTVIDGPFAETKELVAGFWLWQVASMDEAIEWIKRSPFRGTEIELRKIADDDDFSAEFLAEVNAASARRRGASA